MSDTTRGNAISRLSRSADRPWAPIILLLLLAPIMVDVLFGAIQVTTLVALVATIPMYGCAAVLIRGVVRTRHGTWSTIIPLAIAFALAAECLIVQTSLAPAIGLHPHPGYGRALGVNWTYLVWALVYDGLWGVVLPIQLTELLFRHQRTQPWLRPRGLIVVAVVFLLSAVPTWYNYTHLVAPQQQHQPYYQPPLLTMGIAVVMIVALIGTALRMLRTQRQPVLTDRPVPAPWLVGVAILAFGLLWFALTVTWIRLPSWVIRIPAALPLAIALAIGIIAITLLRRWSTARGWTDHHRLAIITGALLASMSMGFIENDQANPVNFAGKIVLNLAAVALLALLSRKFRHDPAITTDRRGRPTPRTAR